MSRTITHVIKRTGDVVPFTPERITNAIYRAAVAVGGRERSTAEGLTLQVVDILDRMFPRNTRVTIARAELEIRKGYPFRAIELLNESLEKTPLKFIQDKIRGYRVLGRAYRNLGDWKGAWESYRQARTIESATFQAEKSPQ